MRRWARSLALVAWIVAGSNVHPEGTAHLSLVPWKVLEPGEAAEAPLVVYWIPASRDEVRRSPLLTSNALTNFSSRCVAMRVVRSDDGARLTGLHVEAELPVVVLVDGEGEILDAVESDRGALSVSEVEDMVRNALDARMADAESRLDDAKRLAAAGELEGALSIYRSVWNDRCLCPRQAKAAQKAIKRLAR